MRRYLTGMTTVLIAVLMAATLVIPATAQDEAPSVSALDQDVLNGAVEIRSVNAPGPGFVVIHADNGEGQPGPVIGHAAVNEGVTENLEVGINPVVATPTLYAMLHTDDNEMGVYEFGQVEGADAPVMADGSPVTVPFSVRVLSVSDQLVESGGQVMVNSVTMPESGWAVLHANNAEGNPADVLGYAGYEAGTTTGLTIDLGDSDPTPVMWVMLHQDTGEAGTYEFGQVEGADAPVMTGGDLPLMVRFWSVPHVRAADQTLHGNNTLVFAQVLIDEPGWLVIHMDDDGSPGQVIGHAALDAGMNTGVTVDVDPMASGARVWAMLHYDTGQTGTYEFGEVEGADGPVTRDGSPVMAPLQVLEGGAMMEDDEAMDETDEAMQPTSVDVSLVEWAIEMPSTVSAGEVTFNVTNSGSVAHNFAIEGNGVEQVFESDLQPGESNSMTVQLDPGNYRVYCPIGNHAAQGMELELTVE